MAQAMRGRRRPADFGDEGNIDDVLVKLYRCATVVKGGRRFSFGALVVVGDRDGNVGYGYGKANEVPPAVEKGIKQARRAMFEVPRRRTTIPHRVTGRFGASKIVLIPASEGTGVIAGSAARAVLELAGVKDVLTKSYGSTSPKNLVKATINGLRQLRSRTTVERLRGVKLDLPPELPEEEAAEQMQAYVDERPDQEQPQPVQSPAGVEPSQTPGAPKESHDAAE
jgi:small subunit ribosomal protein S5